MDIELLRALRIDEGERESRKRFLQLTPADEERIRGLRELFERSAGATIEKFYQHLFGFPEPRRYFPSDEMLERVKGLQAQYFIQLADGPGGEDYFESRLRIGRIHHRLKLHPKWYLGMFSFYIQHTARLISEEYREDPPEAWEHFLSLAKLIFLDLGLAFEANVASLAAAREESQQVALAQAKLERELQLERERRRHEEQIRRVYADVISAVTGGKLTLLAPEELEGRLCPAVVARLPVERPADVREARHTFAAMVGELDISPERLMGLEVSLSEAATNALKHAGGGEITIRRNGDSLQAVVTDEGPGIDFSLLPKAALVTGFSTQVSLGLGFTFMLEYCDRVLLSTGSEGTSVVLLVRQGGQAGEGARGA